MDGPTDCELYGHPLVNGYQCPCKERTHPTRKSVVDPKPYPPPLEDARLMMDGMLSEKEYRMWKANLKCRTTNTRRVYP